MINNTWKPIPTLFFCAVCALGFSQTSLAKTTQPKLESLAELSKTPPSFRQLNIQQWKTTAGSKVLFLEAHELPMLDLRLTFAAGSTQDGDKPGIALLTNSMLNEGVQGMDVTAIAKRFEQVGAIFGNGSYRDMAVISLRGLVEPQKRTIALEMLSKVLGQPSFPESSFKRIKDQLLTGFEIQKKTPKSLLSKELNQKLFGDNPYAHASDGNEQSINSMTIADLQQFYQRAYTSENAVIALVGDLSRKEAEQIAEQVSNALPKGKALVAPNAPKEPKQQRVHIEFPSQQTHIALAQLGVTRNDPDFAALYLGNQILGGSGLSSRLMVEVREKRGLTYGIYSGFSTMQATGSFNIGLQTRAPMTEGTLSLIKDLLSDYLAHGPTEKELQEAKREIAGSFPLSNANNSDIVGQLAVMGFYNLPTNYLQKFVDSIQTLTTDQVKQAMNRHIDLDKFIIVTVGPTVEQQPLPAPTNKIKSSTTRVPEH